MFLVPRLLVPGGPGSAVWLPRDIGRSVMGIVQAATAGGGGRSAVTPAAKPVQAPVASSGGGRQASGVLSSGVHTLIPVVSAACTSCRVSRNASTGSIRVTLGSAQRTATGSAFALLDFGGLDGAGGVVRVHDRIGLDRGEVPQSDLSVLQVTDVENRVAYRLQIDRVTRILRLVSPPGGLNRAGLNVSTGMQVPNDGARTLTVDVAAQAGRSLVVQVDGRTVSSRQGLSGGDAHRQRFLAVGILNTPASMATLSVTHDSLHVNVGTAAGGDESGVSASGIPLSPVVTLVAPANLVPPAISGDAVAGQPLTATLGNWSDADGFRVRWSRCEADGSNCQQIADASGLSYTPDSGDAGSTILVTVTASNGAGSGIATSSLTPVIANTKPAVLAAPSVAGDTTEGATLTASPGTWAWRNGAFTYSWQRCDATGSNCAAITGQTSSTYTLGHDDVGSTIRLLVTAPGLTDTTTAAARVTDVVQLAAPRNLAAPVVDGATVTGSLLSASSGDWSDASASFVYTWDRCSTGGSCATIAGADGNTYRVGIEDLGSTLRVNVAAANSAGVGTASSAPTAAVTLGAPTSVAVPTITGDATAGSTLTLSTGSWSDPQAALTVAWRRCAADGSGCNAIDGASSTAYTLTGNDVGSTINAVVTATNGGGSASATSANTAPVAAAPAPPAPAAPTNATPPTISGDTTVGATLTVDTGAWSDPQATLTVAWQRCAADGSACTVIDGAAGTTYVLTAADIGSTIEAVVTATNAGGSATATSAATAAIADVPAPPPAPDATVAPASTPDAAAAPAGSDLTQPATP